PQPDLKFALTERALERVRLKFDHDACPLYKLNSESAERAEICVQRVTFLREYDTCERAGKNNMPGLKRVTMRPNLVGKPGDAERRVAQYSGSKTRLLDLRISVHDATNPAQIDVHRSNRAPAHRDTCRGTVVRDSVDDLALVLQARIDDLNCRDHIFGRAQNIGQPYARSGQPFAHDEGEFDLDARLAIIGMLDLGAVGNQLVVEDVAIVRLVNHR